MSLLCFLPLKPVPLPLPLAGVLPTGFNLGIPPANNPPKPCGPKPTPFPRPPPLPLVEADELLEILLPPDPPPILGPVLLRFALAKYYKNKEQ